MVNRDNTPIAIFYDTPKNEKIQGFPMGCFLIITDCFDKEFGQSHSFDLVTKDQNP